MRLRAGQPPVVAALGQRRAARSAHAVRTHLPGRTRDTAPAAVRLVDVRLDACAGALRGAAQAYDSACTLGAHLIRTALNAARTAVLRVAVGGNAPTATVGRARATRGRALGRRTNGPGPACCVARPAVRVVVRQADAGRRPPLLGARRLAGTASGRLVLDRGVGRGGGVGSAARGKTRASLVRGGARGAARNRNACDRRREHSCKKARPWCKTVYEHRISASRWVGFPRDTTAGV